MRENTRTKNALLNVSFGYLSLLVLKILAFFVRRVFLQQLSVEFLGINEINSSILLILSLPKTAVDMVAIYMLYGPVANHDNITSSSLLKVFNKIYLILALCTFIIGLLIMPFLSLIISSALPINDLQHFFLISLINTISSYFVASKVDLLIACQENRIQTISTFLTTFVLHVVNIIILRNWPNYYCYLLTTLFATIASNVLIDRVCIKIHKQLFLIKNRIELDTKIIFNKIKDTLIYKLNNVIINNTDSIFISILVNTIAAGIYSNYCVLVVSVQDFIIVASTSLISGIGNLLAKENCKRQREVFDTTLLAFHFVGALGLIGFTLLLNNCITLWLGKEYLLDSLTVFVIAFNFYISNTISPIYMFREANGLFGKVKYLLIIRAIVNIMLSIILGKLWGIFGILLSTTLSSLLTDFWYEPKILFKNILFIPQSRYWKKQIKYFITTTISFVFCYLVIGAIDGQSIVYFVLKTLIIVLITSLMFILASIKTNEQKRIIEIFLTNKINKHRSIDFKDCE